LKKLAFPSDPCMYVSILRPNAIVQHKHD